MVAMAGLRSSAAESRGARSAVRPRRRGQPPSGGIGRAERRHQTDYAVVADHRGCGGLSVRQLHDEGDRAATGEEKVLIRSPDRTRTASCSSGLSADAVQAKRNRPAVTQLTGDYSTLVACSITGSPRRMAGAGTGPLVSNRPHNPIWVRGVRGPRKNGGFWRAIKARGWELSYQIVKGS